MKKIFSLLLIISMSEVMFGQGVGIGITNPHAPLQFSSVAAERKIVLFEAANNDHQFIGFGVNGGGALKYQTAWVGNDHVFQSAITDTSSLELMRIRGNGNVGIGVITPFNRLDLHSGVARSGTHGINHTLYVTGGGEFRSADATTGLGIGSNNIFATGSNVNVDLSFAAKGASGNIIFNTNSAEKMRITASGKVGINNTSPNAPLQFNNIPENRKIVMYEVGNNDHQFMGFGVDGTGALHYQTAANGNDHIFSSGINSTSSSELMRIKGTGNVGIGTIAPNEKLEIGNTGRAFFGDGGGAARKGLLIDGVETNGTRIEAYDYGAVAGIDLLLNSLGGNVGIGVANSNAPLQFSNTFANRKIVLHETADNDNQYAGFGVDGDGSLRYQTDANDNDHIFYTASGPSASTELMRIKGTGQVGIGTSLPHAPLQFSNISENRKVVLSETANNNHQFIGLGQNTTSLRYQVDATTSNHIFYAGTSTTTSTELMRIEGTGEVGIGIAAPANKLDIASAARTGTHNTGLALYVTGGGEFRSADATSGLGIGSNNIFATGSNANVDLSIAAKGASGNIILTTNGAEKVRIVSSGNVGIGTTTPHSALQFSNNVTTKKVVLFETNNNINEFSGLGVDNLGSMTYQVPSEDASYIFSAGAGSNSSVELLKFSSLFGFQFERGVIMGGNLTAYGNVNIGGAVTIDSAIITEPFIQPTLQSGFTNYNLGYATAAYYKDKMNIVHLRGLVLLNANQNGLTIFTLPVNYRPASSGTLLFTTTANTGAARIDIKTNGTVVVMGSSNGWISLDGITFRAD